MFDKLLLLSSIPLNAIKDAVLEQNTANNLRYKCTENLAIVDKQTLTPKFHTQTEMKHGSYTPQGSQMDMWSPQFEVRTNDKLLVYDAITGIMHPVTIYSS
eukprot:924896_1